MTPSDATSRENVGVDEAQRRAEKERRRAEKEQRRAAKEARQLKASGRNGSLSSKPTLRHTLRWLKSKIMPGSSLDDQLPVEEFRTVDYWEQRYADGGHSGRGSYGVLAQYKADVINAFVRDNGLTSVIEHGCGDGNQASLFDIPRYVGYDVSRTAAERAKERNRERANFEFYHIDDIELDDRSYELALSLDVIFHLVEEHLYDEYMSRLFKSACRYVVIYCTNYDQESDANHMRHRQFMRWVNENAPEWKLEEVIQNPYSAEDTPKQNRSKAHFHILRKS